MVCGDAGDAMSELSPAARTAHAALRWLQARRREHYGVPSTVARPHVRHALRAMGCEVDAVLAELRAASLLHVDETRDEWLTVTANELASMRVFGFEDGQ